MGDKKERQSQKCDGSSSSSRPHHATSSRDFLVAGMSFLSAPATRAQRRFFRASRVSRQHNERSPFVCSLCRLSFAVKYMRSINMNSWTCSCFASNKYSGLYFREENIETKTGALSCCSISQRARYSHSPRALSVQLQNLIKSHRSTRYKISDRRCARSCAPLCALNTMPLFFLVPVAFRAQPVAFSLCWYEFFASLV